MTSDWLTDAEINNLEMWVLDSGVDRGNKAAMRRVAHLAHLIEEVRAWRDHRLYVRVNGEIGHYLPERWLSTRQNAPQSPHNRAGGAK